MSTSLFTYFEQERILAQCVSANLRPMPLIKFSLGDNLWQILLELLSKCSADENHRKLRRPKATKPVFVAASKFDERHSSIKTIPVTILRSVGRVPWEECFHVLTAQYKHSTLSKPPKAFRPFQIPFLHTEQKTFKALERHWLIEMGALVQAIAAHRVQ
jgi:hypothetical protein